jgi:hypothetical protein
MSTATRTLSLRQKQTLFSLLSARLIVWIQQQGWAVTLGEGYDDDHKGHMVGSLHYERLALDMNLFTQGAWEGDIYLGGAYVADGGHPAWAAIGTKWKSMHPLCRWGGDFKGKDSNHISIAHDGKA